MWGWGWMHGGGYWTPYMWIWGGFRLLLMAAVIVGIVFLARAAYRRGWGGGQSRETPLEILQKRYARGEITKEEFEEMKRNLG